MTRYGNLTHEVRTVVAARSVEELTWFKDSEWYPARAAVAQHELCPVEWLVEFADDPRDDVKAAAAGHPRLPADVFGRLVRDGNLVVRSACAGSPVAPENLLRGLAASDAETSTHLAARLFLNPACPLDVKVDLIRGQSIDLATLREYNRHLVTEFRTITYKQYMGRGRAHTQSATIPVEPGGRYPVDLIRAMVDSENPSFVRTAAAQPDAPTELLVSLSAHTDLFVRTAVAGNPSTPEDVLIEMATNDKSLAVVRDIASRTNLTLPVAAAVVRRGAASAAEKLPREVLHALALKGDEATLVALPKSVDLHIQMDDTWKVLLSHPSEKVCGAAAKKAPLTLLSVDHPSVKVRCALAERTSDTLVLKQMVDDESKLVRRRLARNPNLDGISLAKLGGDDDALASKRAGDVFFDALLSQAASLVDPSDS